MSNSEKYIPKVGEAFEWCYENAIKWSKANPVILVTDKEVAYKADSGHLVVVSNLCQFRPIPTKADVEREQLIMILSKNLRYLDKVAKEIQKAGFTIPKKVKRSKIRARLCESLESLHFISVETATDEMVNFLGDLVEDEA